MLKNMANCTAAEKRLKNEGPRRIYKGDVPYLYDHDTDFLHKIAKPSCFRFRPAPNSEEPPHPEDVVPTTVRRKSLETNNNEVAHTDTFQNNAVITSRYTMWDFLPKNLFEQFRRVVNFYFLVVAFVQTIIDSPVHPVTAVSPLAFVILVTAIKQGYEDWLRHKNDDQVNNRSVKVVRDGVLLSVKSKDIEVGDIVNLEADEQVPTDMLIIGSSDEFLRCQINTANLDGETNLKLRYCPSGLPHFKSVEDLNHLHVIIECEQPNADLYEFCGSLLIPASKLKEMQWSPTESQANVNYGEGDQENLDMGSVSGKSPDVGSMGVSSLGTRTGSLGASSAGASSMGATTLESASLRKESITSSFDYSSKRSSGASDESAPPEIPLQVKSGIVRQGMSDFLSIPLSMDNLVLRGTRLKNTNYIFGVVVYTGKDTRLARNSEKTQSKFSTVEGAVNYYLIFFICLLTLLVVFCSIMHFVVDWHSEVIDGGLPWYLKDNSTTKLDVSEVLNTIASFSVLFNYIIPISLYVTIELQKFLGSKFFAWDQDMVDEEGREPLCNTSDLNEELGQIEYLFSDKTGTLTQNVMKFRHCSIDGIRYEYNGQDSAIFEVDTENPRKPRRTPNLTIFHSEKILTFFKTLAICHSVQVVPKRRVSIDSNAIRRYSVDESCMEIKETNSELARRREMLVTPESSNGFPIQGNDGFGMEYQASSPDEKALLESCEKLGIRYCGEKEDVMTLDIAGQLETFKRLMHLEFDADRKCMSVIVENEGGEKWLLTKGAESAIIPKCDDGPAQQTLKHVLEYALTGLRTLAVAIRKLTDQEYDDFTTELRAARRLIKNRQEKVREVYRNIESHMTVIGATGVEDQLQEHVPETLQSFAAAGIHVWMLTGDKLETGVNVAISCGLITASTKQYLVGKPTSLEGVKSRLQDIFDEMESDDNTCFVIDGDSLAVAFKGCPELLRDVSMKALRVVCCRMAPLQKAQVVQMVKNSPQKPTCCAVGDGANDCAMILAAHVGIGILGKEGRQAARCADFALAKFGHLRKAILVHGHWYYVRLANLANYFFYKNVVFVMPQFFYSFNSNFSTQALFSGLFLMNYNIFFAACPIFYYGLLEQPYSAKTLMENPHLYKKNKKNAVMSSKNFFPWLLSALWHSAVVYYCVWMSWPGNFDDMDNLMSFGTVIFSGVVLTSNMKMLVETTYLTWWYLAAQIYSYVVYFIISSIYSEIDLSFIGMDVGDFSHVYFTMLRSYCFWMLMLIIMVAAALPDLVHVFLRHAREHHRTKYLKAKERAASIDVEHFEEFSPSEDG